MDIAGSEEPSGSSSTPSAASSAVSSLADVAPTLVLGAPMSTGAYAVPQAEPVSEFQASVLSPGRPPDASPAVQSISDPGPNSAGGESKQTDWAG